MKFKTIYSVVWYILMGIIEIGILIEILLGIKEDYIIEG